MHNKRRFLSSRIELAQDQKRSTVTLTRVGSFTDPRYGRFEITEDMLLSMVKNFNAGVFGQEIFIDVDHKSGDGAAARILKLFVSRGRLRADVEWTPHGIDAVKNRGFRYLSAEFSENFQDNEEGRQHGPTLLGAGLTIRPVIKRLDPIQLSEPEGSAPVYVHPELVRQLAQHLEMTVNKHLEQLKKQLAEAGLAEPLIKQLSEAFKQAATHLGDDENALKSLAETFAGTGKELADMKDAGEVKLSIEIPEHKQDTGSKTLSEADVRRILADHAASVEKESRKLAEQRDANLKRFQEKLNAVKLSDSTVKELTAAVSDVITPEMTAEQVDKLATGQIALAQRIEAARKLSAMGYQPAGSPHIELGEDNTVKALSELTRSKLKLTGAAINGQLKLPEESKAHPLVQKVLSDFDRRHAMKLAEEHKRLSSDGSTGIADTSLPVSYQRQVILEALSDLNLLQIVQADTDPNASTTTEIPYETRDVSQVVNDGIVYEGAGIPFAGVTQAMDTAYINAMKIALKVSNEVMHFSSASAIAWDAWGRNIASNARFLRELVARRIANELQRSADAYLAGSVSNEDISGQLTGSAHTIKTAQFPIVRPNQDRDLKGNAVGVEENPITVRLNGTAIQPFDGSGTQAAGTYYRVTNYNLGYIQFVDETGAPVTPSASAGADDVSYNYATNVAKVDLDVPSGTTLERHLNKLLQGIGARKAVLQQDRFVTTDYLVASPTLHNTITNAENFDAGALRKDVAMSMEGDLEAVKGLAAFGTNAPGIDLGDERILIGQRGQLGYVIAKPFVTGQPFDRQDSNGHPTGEKVAYGEEYNAIHVPAPVRNRMTSVLAYSFSGR